MKIKNKGKVYPSPSSSSSSPPSSVHGDDFLSVLKLLPPTILILTSVLSIEDREVLAYLINRSIKTTTTISGIQDSEKKQNKKKETHKPPVFDCDCFDCYTSYWLRWDSSLNRELIHQAIESFEDHLTSGESQRPRKNNGRAKKKKEKSGCRSSDKPVGHSGRLDLALSGVESKEPVKGLPEAHVSAAVSPAREANDGEEEVRKDSPEVVRSPAESGHKGLETRLLPDVWGLFTWRLWGSWNLNS